MASPIQTLSPQSLDDETFIRQLTMVLHQEGFDFIEGDLPEADREQLTRNLLRYAPQIFYNSIIEDDTAFKRFMVESYKAGQPIEGLQAALVTITEQVRLSRQDTTTIQQALERIETVVTNLKAGNTYNQQGQIVFGDQYNAGRDIHIHAKPYTPPLIRPERAKHFTDRETELAALLADLRPGRKVTLCGPGGMGKTALAAEAIWSLAPGDSLPERFPDGVYAYSFYNQPQAAVALEDMALAFGEEAKPTPQAAARRALANRRALLLLDGAEDADDLPAVLQAAPTCGVIITTRRRSDAPADFTDLSPLPPDEAATLLRRWIGQPLTIGEAEAGELCALVGYLPLAVRLAGRYLARSGDSAATTACRCCWPAV